MTPLGVDNKYGRIWVERITKRVDDDEPLFLLRAKDEFALAILRSYTKVAEQNKMPSEFLDSLKEVYKQFSNWRAANSELIKKPD